MRMGVGAANVDVTPYVSTRRSQSSGVEPALDDDRLAEGLGDAHEPAGPRVVERDRS